MVAKSSIEALVQAERCLGAGCATRVNSIISVFFERLGNQEDAFPAIDGCQACWSELGGRPEKTVLLREIPAQLRDLQDRAEASGSPYGRAVSRAINATGILVREWRTESSDFSPVIAEAVAVAIEFDRLGIDAPGGHNSWVSFELGGQAALAALIFKDAAPVERGELFVIETSAGSGSMAYHRVINELFRPRAISPATPDRPEELCAPHDEGWRWE